jgi:hypothetical protein
VVASRPWELERAFGGNRAQPVRVVGDDAVDTGIDERFDGGAALTRRGLDAGVEALAARMPVRWMPR